MRPSTEPKERVGDWSVFAMVLTMVVAAAPAGAQAAADTVPPAGVEDTVYTFTSGRLTLSGTLARPRAAGPAPVAVIVAGSGPTDRNGNSALGIRPNSYAQLAWGLAQHGVASLRYDKRVLPATTGPVDLTALTFDDFVDDAAAATRALAGDPRFLRVVIVGHSEGGAIAIRAAQRPLPLAGIALVSTAGRTLEAILHEQVARQVDAATLERYDSAMARYLGDRDPGDVPAGLISLFAPVNRRFTQSLARLDPEAELATTRLPVLIVQGTTDIQVRVRDAEALHRARPDAKLVMLPGVNHVLKQVADTTLPGQLPAYRQPTVPVAPAVINEIAGWIRSLR